MAYRSRFEIIENTASSITAALLNELTKQKIKVVFCDEKRNPSSELIPYYGSHDTSLKVRSQTAWQPIAKQAVWTAVVREKIKNQRDNLILFECSEYKLLDRYIEELEFADELELLYRDILNNHINLFVIENNQYFETNRFEEVYIYDNDFCEIIENRPDLL